MPQRRFAVLFWVVSAAATAAFVLIRAAARDGGGTLTAVAVLSGAVAVIGILILARVVAVAERSRRPR